MRDIRIRFNGSDATRLDLHDTVEGKSLYEQKYLLNTAVTKGTDPIYPDRGTDMLRQSIGGTIVDTNEAMHTGNFAAVDTLYFCSYEEHPEVYNLDEYVQAYQLIPAAYDNATRTLSFRAVFLFKDGTSTDSTFSISSQL